MTWRFLFFAFFSVPVLARVHMYGDSILASNTPVQQDLETFGHVEIQNFAKIGAGMRDGWVESIPSVYVQNKDLVAPDTIILNGGGNDINSVRRDCLDMTQTCNNTIDQVVAVIDSLMQDMKRDGVGDIVYVGFFNLCGFERAVDSGNDKIQDVCSRTSHCYFVDLRVVPIVVGWDGMHPIEASYHDISHEIWKTMVKHNIPL